MSLEVYLPLQFSGRVCAVEDGADKAAAFLREFPDGLVGGDGACGGGPEKGRAKHKAHGGMHVFH